MSHQVKLSKLVYTDLEMLKRAIASEGLQTTDIMHGYHQQWKKGQTHPQGILEFGIETKSGLSPCGIVKAKDGTYQLVGDSYNVNYQGEYGLGQLSANLNQRYQMAKVEEYVTNNGWEIEVAPSTLLKHNNKGEIEFVISPARSTQTIGMCL